LILAPAIAAAQLLRPNGSSAIVDLVSRGMIYGLAALLLLAASGSHRWFLARNPG